MPPFPPPDLMDEKGWQAIKERIDAKEEKAIKKMIAFTKGGADLRIRREHHFKAIYFFQVMRVTKNKTGKKKRELTFIYSFEKYGDAKNFIIAVREKTAKRQAAREMEIEE